MGGKSKPFMIALRAVAVKPRERLPLRGPGPSCEIIEPSSQFTLKPGGKANTYDPSVATAADTSAKYSNNNSLRRVNIGFGQQGFLLKGGIGPSRRRSHRSTPPAPRPSGATAPVVPSLGGGRGGSRAIARWRSLFRMRRCKASSAGVNVLANLYRRFTVAFCGGQLIKKPYPVASRPTAGCATRPPTAETPRSAPGRAMGAQWRATFVVVLPAGGKRRHRDLPVTFQRIAQQVAIAGLEYMQRLHYMGEHHEIRHWKQSDRARKIARREGVLIKSPT